MPDKDVTPAVERRAFTVDEYCTAHGICRGTLYKLWRGGGGPRFMKIGDRRLISVEAADEYRRKLEGREAAD